MSDGNYRGTAPGTLRIEYRADGNVRFRVEQLGGLEAIVDLTPQRVDELVADLTKRDKS